MSECLWVHSSSLLWYLDLNAKILAQHFCFVLLLAPMSSIFSKDLAKSSQIIFELNVKLRIQLRRRQFFFVLTPFFFPTALLFPSVNTGYAPQVCHPKKVANTVFLIGEVESFARKGPELITVPRLQLSPFPLFSWSQAPADSC